MRVLQPHYMHVMHTKCNVYIYVVTIQNTPYDKTFEEEKFLQIFTNCRCFATESFPAS